MGLLGTPGLLDHVQPFSGVTCSSEGGPVAYQFLPRVAGDTFWSSGGTGRQGSLEVMGVVRLDGAAVQADNDASATVVPDQPPYPLAPA